MYIAIKTDGIRSYFLFILEIMTTQGKYSIILNESIKFPTTISTICLLKKTAYIRELLNSTLMHDI